MRERRSEPRKLTCIPAGFEEDRDRQEHLALIHDVSVHGGTLYTRERLEIGERLDLGMHLDANPDGVRPATARVVHCERRPWENSDFWTWQVGVEFDEPIDKYQDAIEALARRQRAAGLPIP
jgi:hypothetical protein